MGATFTSALIVHIRSHPLLTLYSRDDYANRLVPINFSYAVVDNALVSDHLTRENGVN